MFTADQPTPSGQQKSEKQDQLIQELAANTSASEEDVREMVTRMSGQDLDEDEMKQLEALTKFTGMDVRSVLSRIALRILQLGVVATALGGGLLFYQAGDLSNITSTWNEMGAASWIIIIGLISILSGTALLSQAKRLASNSRQFIDSTIAEIAQSDPALATEMLDTEEDLAPLYVQDRRHQW